MDDMIRTADRGPAGIAGDRGRGSPYPVPRLPVPRLLESPRARRELGLVLWTVSRPEAELKCRHVGLMHAAKPRTPGCELCQDHDVTWTELRVCSSCGHVGCCDRSRFRHADQHFRNTGHPVVESLGVDRVSWSCYVDQVRVFAAGEISAWDFRLTRTLSNGIQCDEKSWKG